MEHDRERLGALGLGRHRERRTGGLDPLLGSADALRHGRFGDEEGAGDLGGGQAPNGPERERELRSRRERRVAAEEEQDQRVVLFGALLVSRRRVHLVGGRSRRGDVLAAAPGLVAAQLVGDPPRGDGDQPGARVVRHTLRGPLHRGGEQGLLHRVLTRVEGSVAAHERAEDLRRGLTQQALDALLAAHISVPPSAISGRISTALNLAYGTRAAISIARSRLSQSMMSKLPRYSLASR